MVRRWGIIGVVWVSVGAAILGFYLPWAHINLREPALVKQLRDASRLGDTVSGFTRTVGRIAVKIRRGAETITGDLPVLGDLPTHISGAEIPTFANQQNAQVAIALAELLTRKRQPIGQASYAVYLVPGIALLCGLLLTVLGGAPVVAAGAALVCAGIAGAGFWTLLTTNTSTLFVAITIGQGLWLSLWAYAVLALCGVLLLVVRPHPIMRARPGRGSPAPDASLS